eukprot:SAG31_NODE_1257_length_9081_cov_7.585838_4_plen_47_part_00
MQVGDNDEFGPIYKGMPKTLNFIRQPSHIVSLILLPLGTLKLEIGV